LILPVELVHKFWSDIANYEKVGETVKGYLIEHSGLAPKSSVLDVGCATGRMAAVTLTEYLDADGHYEGFDIIPEGIQWCVENITSRFPNFRFQVADLYNRAYNHRGHQEAHKFVFLHGGEWFDVLCLHPCSLTCALRKYGIILMRLYVH